MNDKPKDGARDPRLGCLEADLAQLRNMPVPDGLEARLVEQIPWRLRPRRTAVLGWVCGLAAATAACIAVGVLAWQVGYHQGRRETTSLAKAPAAGPGWSGDRNGKPDGSWVGLADHAGPGGAAHPGGGGYGGIGGLERTEGGPVGLNNRLKQTGSDPVRIIDKLKQLQKRPDDGSREIVQFGAKPGGANGVDGAEPGPQPPRPAPEWNVVMGDQTDRFGAATGPAQQRGELVPPDPDHPIVSPIVSKIAGEPPLPAGTEEDFHNGNTAGVQNGPPPNPTRWTIGEPVLIIYVNTYHWHDGRGATPGKISLKHQDGTVYGPWQTKGAVSSGVKDAFWFAEPNVIVKPGTYTVLDSDPATWSQNAESGQCGHALIRIRRLAVRAGITNSLRAGLVALWSGDGDARDGAGDNHGQIKEGVTLAEGKFGQAFKLDGNSGYIEFPSSKALHIAGDQTISMWINPERLDKTRFLISLSYNELRVFVTAEGVLGYSYGTDGSPRWEHVELNTGPGAEHTVESGPPVKLAVEGRRAVVRPGEWAHVAVVRDLKSRKLRWYVNGEMVCQGPAEIAAPSISGEPLFVGRTRLDSSPDFARFCGRIDDVAIWRRPLSAEEVRAMFTGALHADNPLARGLVAVWAGDGDARNGIGVSHGKINEGVTFAGGRFGQAFKLDGKNGFVDFGSSKALQITGDQTISLWIKPDRLGLRQNPIAKACGGEGTITLEPDGAVSYDYGTSGDAQHSPYCYIGTYGSAHAKYADNQPTLDLKSTGGKATIPAGQWSHVVVVRDLQARKLRLYIDGRQIIEGEAVFPAAVATELPMLIGKGYTNNFAGLIDDVGVWNRALSADEVRLLHDAPGLREVALGCIAIQTPPTVTQVEGADRVTTAEGTMLLGTLGNRSFSATTTFGRIEIAAANVVGIVPIEADPNRFWLLLTEGQAIRGELADTMIDLKAGEGSVLKIPLKNVREVSMRSAKRSAGQAVPATAGAAMTLILRTGERVACSALDEELALDTPYGRITLAGADVLSLIPWYSGLVGSHVMLSSGSQISGTLAQEKLTLRLRLGPEATINREQLASLTRPGEAQPPGDRAVMTMRNGDRLVGELTDKTLTVHTQFGDLRFWPPSARTIRFGLAGSRAASVALYDGSAVNGELVEKTVTFAIGAGETRLKVPVTLAESVVRSTALPPTEVVEKVAHLISQLGAESYKDRQEATDSLIKLGPGIIPLLEKHLDAPDPEIRNRLEQILEKLRPKAKEASSPQDPPKQLGRQLGWGGVIAPVPHVGPERL